MYNFRMATKKHALADLLDQAELADMAAKAREGYYDDFESGLATPAMQLEADLRKAGTPAAMAIRARHLQGEFDS